MPTAPTTRGRQASASAVPSDAEITEITDLLRLIADPTRARILYILLEADELRVSEIAQEVGASDSTVSHALRLLRTSGAVRNHRQGRSIVYRLRDDHIRALLDVLRSHVRHDGEGQP